MPGCGCKAMLFHPARPAFWMKNPAPKDSLQRFGWQLVGDDLPAAIPARPTGERLL